MTNILDNDICDKLCAAAKNKADEMGINISFAICDEKGLIVLFRRFDGAPVFSNVLVPKKAYTSAVMFMPTEKLAMLCKDGGPLMGIQNNDSKITLVSGGHPLFIDGKCVGGIGVGGGRGNEDPLIAEHVVSIFNELIK